MADFSCPQLCGLVLRIERGGMMVSEGICNGRFAAQMGPKAGLACAAFLALSACIPTKLPKIPLPDLTEKTMPAMRWDHRPEAASWTSAALLAVEKNDAALASRIPADIETWCPGYAAAPLPDRRAFWVGLLSAVAKYESTWNPAASGAGGRYIGLMQISPKSAANYGCDATSSKALKDGAANLACAVTIVSYHVARDDLVAGKGNRGIGRDWGPLRKSDKRAEMAEWTRRQDYCQ